MTIAPALGQSNGLPTCLGCHAPESGGRPHSPEQAAGLCWPHARRLIRESRGDIAAEIQGSVASRFESLAAELSEYLRKSDWNNRHEPRGSEQDSWLRALRALGGEPSLDVSPIAESTAAAPKDPFSALLRPMKRLWRLARRPPVVKPDLAGLKIETALQQPGCHACSIGAEGVRHWLWMLLWEGVMDPEIRGRIRAADGFCPAHWWRLNEVERREIHGTTGVAILAEDTLSSLATQLRAGAVPYGPTTSRCLACQAHRRAVSGALSGTARHLTRPEFRATYFATAGCCAAHRLALARLLEDPELADSVQRHSAD